MKNEINEQVSFIGSCVESNEDVVWEKVVSGEVNSDKLSWMGNVSE